jgi:hypothetical protein
MILDIITELSQYHVRDGFPVLEMKILLTGPNQILEFILIYSKIKTEKYTGSNKDLLIFSP